MKPYQDRVLAHLSDRRLELDLAAIDLNAFGRELLGDLARRHRAEELALLTRLGGKLKPLRLEAVALRLEGPAFTRHPLGDHALVVLELAYVGIRRVDRLALGEKIVPREARLYRHDFAGVSETRYVLAQNELHVGHG